MWCVVRFLGGKCKANIECISKKMEFCPWQVYLHKITRTDNKEDTTTRESHIFQLPIHFINILWNRNIQCNLNFKYCLTQYLPLGTHRHYLKNLSEHGRVTVWLQLNFPLYHLWPIRQPSLMYSYNVGKQSELLLHIRSHKAKLWMAILRFLWQMLWQ